MNARAKTCGCGGDAMQQRAYDALSHAQNRQESNKVKLLAGTSSMIRPTVLVLLVLLPLPLTLARYLNVYGDPLQKCHPLYFATANLFHPFVSGARKLAWL
jgi:hypothetical protein